VLAGLRAAGIGLAPAEVDDVFATIQAFHGERVAILLVKRMSRERSRVDGAYVLGWPPDGR
jgi:ABC-type branched-subunit amino acid transport system ATPase component